jgi:hypothetical protein
MKISLIICVLILLISQSINLKTKTKNLGENKSQWGITNFIQKLQKDMNTYSESMHGVENPHFNSYLQFIVQAY